MKKQTSELLRRIRQLMRDPSFTGPEKLSAYIVPSNDAHNSEYLAEHDKRRSFISGFTGSAGTAIITAKNALLWTDGRYYAQAEAELDHNWTLMRESLPDTPSQSKWLVDNLETGSVVGVDPFIFSNSLWTAMEQELEVAGLKLVGTEKNLVDIVWGTDQPPRPEKSVFPLEIEFAGKTWETKVEEIREQMIQKKVDILVITALDEIAWLLNLRGSDIECNPVFFSFCVVALDRVYLFINENQVTDIVIKHLTAKSDEKNVVEIRPYETIRDFVSRSSGKRLWFGNTASYGILSLQKPSSSDSRDDSSKMPLSIAKPVISVSPVALAKAIKNPIELEGFENCHIRDGAALCQFFAWLEKEVPKGYVTEMIASDKLFEIRSLMSRFMGPSFETISAGGPNGAIIHYRSSEETNRLLTPEELYLVDSGGQYKDGTTDVTRTVHFGTPSAHQKDTFTRVLKGQIALGTSIFPNKTKGNCLDSFARKYLWDIGLDYGHGTGHGVGSFLNVHEGPMGISWRPNPHDPGLQEGMILSNEPGYYENGNFGIRIENLIKIVPAQTPNSFEKKGFLTFKTITYCPIQKKMIDPSLLTKSEVEHLNNYHEECKDKVGPLLHEMGLTDGLKWLIKETEPLG